MNIGHGHKKSSGPDLLLSYHDNDHYSSVRDATQQKKKSNDNDEESVNGRDSKGGKKQKNSKKAVGKGTADEKESESNGKSPEKSKQSTRPLRKNAMCHCRSGKKYKNCCLLIEKREARLRKVKGCDESMTENETSKDDSFEMNGNFRVLQI